MDDEKLEKEAIEKFVNLYSSKMGFDLNPDKEICNTIIEGLAKNKIKHGYRFCPCRPLTSNMDIDKDKICPCKWHKAEIEKDGHCHCVLFFKKALAK